MNKEIITSAIDTLLNLFYGEKRNQYVAMKTLELYFEIGVFKDASLVADVIEEQRGFALLEPMKLYDMTVAGRIECVLSGFRHF